jgi:hypothetical protein
MLTRSVCLSVCLALGDTGGRQRVGEGDEYSRRLFVADEFARLAGRVPNLQQ